MPIPASLHAYLLGQARLIVRNEPIPEQAWSRRAARSLLLLLLITPGNRLPRDQVLDALWPNSTLATADSALRKAVHALRRVLEPNLQAGRASAFLEVGGQVIALRRDIDLWLDIDTFEQELALARSAAPDQQRAHLHQALALYCGDLIADAPYLEWAESRRQHLRELRRRAALTLAGLDLEAEEPAAAVSRLEPLLQAEPTDEIVLRTLMRALTQAGQRDDALRWYRQTVEILHAEFDAGPEDATRHVADEIRALEPPPVAPVSISAPLRIRSTVPAPPNPLIGRARELERLQDLLLDPNVRLVTVTGPGGVGKTRLAQELARQVAEEFTDGVCYVPLATMTDPAQVLPAVARALGLAEIGNTSPSEAIAAALHGRALLLVLDNLEQIIDVGTDLATLLEACDGLTMLATSRAPLHLRAEHLFDAPPLPVPRLDHGRKVAVRNDAVALFAQRAGAVSPEFAVTSENVHTVAAICAHLDGLPLAIELAAAHSRSMSPLAIVEQLEDRFALLASGYRDLPPRQRTMRDSIAWSYDLLTPAEQGAFNRFSVFVGGFTLEAAVAVDDTAPSSSMAEVVAALTEKGLLHREDSADGPRYGMLETIREYGLERLAASGKEEGVRRGHAAHFVALAERAAPELRGAEQEEWFDLLDSEHDNLRAALVWALNRKASDVALRIGAALTPFWVARGYLSEGRAWLTHALQDDTPPLPLRAAALSAAGSLAENQNDYAPAEALHREALTAWRELGDASRISATLSSLGNAALGRNDFDAALEFHQQALAICRDIDDQWGVARAFNGLGVAAYYQGAYDRAAMFWRECLCGMRAVGDTRSECNVLNNLGTIAVQQGDFPQAVTLHEQALALRRRLGDKQGIGSSLINLGEIAQQQGDLVRAEQLLEEATDILQELGDEWNVTIAMLTLARVTRERGEMPRAVALIRESLASCSRTGDLFSLAGTLESAAGLLAGQQALELATHLFGAAAVLWERIGGAREQITQAAYEHDVAHAQAALGDARFAAAWDVGTGMPLERAVAEAIAALDDVEL